MKIIAENEHKKIIYLDDLDELEITSVRNNDFKLNIKCLNSILHIEELGGSDKIFYDEEKNAIDSMKKYLDKNPKKPSLK